MERPIFINIVLEEEWRFITYPDVVKNRYLVSNYGRVLDLKTYKEIEPYYSSFNNVLNLKSDNASKCPSKLIPLHRLMLYTFNYFDGCLDYYVKHRDNNNRNNILSNLEWCKRPDNYKIYDYDDFERIDSNLLRKICSDVNRGFTLPQLLVKYSK